MFYRDPVPEDIEDLRRFLDDHFRRVEDAFIASNELIGSLSVAAYGFADLTTPQLFDIGAGYDTIPFDSAFSGRGIDFDTANNTFNFNVSGYWRLSYFVNIQNITELNQSRNFEIRAYNVTQAAAEPAIVYPVSRNQGDILASVSLIIQINNTNDNFRLEIGGVDAITGGTLSDVNISANVVSELQTLVGS